MRCLAFAISSLPRPAIVETLMRTDVINAATWVFEDEGRSDVIPVFTIPTKAPDDVSDGGSTPLHLASTLMKGAAMERGGSYGACVLEWAPSCAETPDGDCMDRLRPWGWG
jgi:hypothetical protein